jgi:hypothetical protein
LLNRNSTTAGSGRSADIKSGVALHYAVIKPDGKPPCNVRIIIEGRQMQHLRGIRQDPPIRRDASSSATRATQSASRPSSALRGMAMVEVSCELSPPLYQACSAAPLPTPDVAIALATLRDDNGDAAKRHRL